MQASVIVSVYKEIKNLSLILKALDLQSNQNFEVIISEDDHSLEMIEFIKIEKKKHGYPIHHVHQNLHDGFRKNKMLNLSLSIAKGRLLIFLDGDCIPHKELVAQYLKQARPNRIMTGRRVMLTPLLTEKLHQSGDLKKVSIWTMLKDQCRHAEEGLFLPFLPKTKPKSICGCNWAVYKEHLLAINGYDEDYTTAGNGEDVDVEWRLLKIGCQLFSMKFRAIVYHLHHEANYNEEDMKISRNLLTEKMSLGMVICSRGLKRPQQTTVVSPKTVQNDSDYPLSTPFC